MLFLYKCLMFPSHIKSLRSRRAFFFVGSLEEFLVFTLKQILLSQTASGKYYCSRLVNLPDLNQTQQAIRGIKLHCNAVKPEVLPPMSIDVNLQ